MSLMNYKEITAESALITYPHVDGGWSWARYFIDPYVGCQYGATFGHKWDPDAELLDDAEGQKQIPIVTANAHELFQKEIEKKRKDIVHIGSWQEVERKYRISRKILQHCLEVGFPIFALETSNIILDEIDLIKEIAEQSFANIAFSAMAAPSYAGHQQVHFFDAFSPSSASRFHAMEKLASRGITTGLVFNPILPYIFDSDENIEKLCRITRDSGGSYILAMPLMLDQHRKEKYYRTLRKHFTDVINKYTQLYSGNPLPHERYTVSLMEKIAHYAHEYELSLHAPRYIEPGEKEMNMRVAERLFNKAREIEFLGKDKTRSANYKKIAEFIDELNYDIKTVYDSMGIDGIKKFNGVGSVIAEEIELVLQS